MKNIVASEYGVIPNKDVSRELSLLLAQCIDIQEEKVIHLQGGNYYLDATKCDSKLLYITNSMADNEWDKGETPHLNAIAINISGISNLKISGNGAKFIIDGRVTNVVIQNSKNIVLEDIALDVINPQMHELEVINKAQFYVDFKLDNGSQYVVENGLPYFVGKGYKVPFTYKAKTSYWNAKVLGSNKGIISRERHPFATALKIKELAKNVFRAYYIARGQMEIGDTFCIFDVKRKNAGIFIDNSANITIKGVKQHFNYGLALVAQNSENITIDSVDFSSADRLMASVADFNQICMCRGDVIVKNSNFVGAGDDCLNVHGFHFEVEKIDMLTVTVAFKHPQSHSFNPLRVGDTVEFISKNTLGVLGSATILQSKLVSPKTIQLVLDNTKGLSVGSVLEDTTACPKLQFVGNTMDRIITRGLLITNRAKVIVNNNKFLHTTMNSILLSNDAKSWYESGRVYNLIIKNNYFKYCPEYTLMIKPENGTSKIRPHKNIVFSNNKIDYSKGFYIKNADNVVIQNNSIGCKSKIKNINSTIKTK